MNAEIYGHMLWRCHIDTSAPNPVVWRFLLPYINACSGALFTMPEFVGPGLKVPLYEVSPCIDPLAEKNKQLTRAEALAILDPLFTTYGIDADRPILAAVSRYDIHKNQATVLDAFKTLRAGKALDRPPILIFLGNTATDDPEGEWVLSQLKERAAGDPDVFFWVNVPDNDRVVGALMHVARACVHVATKEGFGLVVSEALWQGTPVIASRAGGIKKQVLDGETGVVADAKDTAQVAARMRALLTDEALATRLGEQGREHVRTHFLLPELMRRELLLMRHLCGIDHATPNFRMNGTTYVEAQAERRASQQLRPAA